jgi:hypothetical protein
MKLYVHEFGFCTAHKKILCLAQWGQRLEGWPNPAALLAGWRRVTQKGVILYVMDCTWPHHLPQSCADILLNAWTKHPLRYVTKALPGSLVDPCLLSGLASGVSTQVYRSRIHWLIFLCFGLISKFVFSTHADYALKIIKRMFSQRLKY